MQAQAQDTNRMVVKSTPNSRLTSSALYSSGGDITVEAWVYPTTSDSWVPIVTLSPPDSVPSDSYYDYGEYAFTLSGRYAYLEVWAYDEWFSCDSGSPLPINTWSHVAFVIQGTTFSIYVNGSLRSVEQRGVAVRSNGYVVNVAGDPYGYLPHPMADVRIWSVARTAAQLSASMPIGSITGPTTGLVANWSFGQTGLPILADAAGNMPLAEVGTIHYSKLLSGTLVTTAANTQAGPLTIEAGTFQVGDGGTAGTLGAGPVVNKAALAFNRSDGATWANLLSGSGTLTKSGAGTLALTAANTLQGTTTISGGTLQLGDGGTAGSLGSSNLVNNASLVFNRSDALAVSGVISGTGSVTQSGPGTTTLSGNNTYQGTTTISAGTLQVGDGGATGSLGSGNVVNNGTLAFNRTNDLSLSTSVSGTGALTHSGSGTLVVLGNNTYSGTTTISQGTLQVGNGGTSGSLGSGPVVNQGSLVLNRSDSLLVGQGVTGSGSLRKSGTGVLTLAAGYAATGDVHVEGGTLAIPGTTLFSASSLRLAGGSVLDVSSRPSGLALGANQSFVALGDHVRVVGSLNASAATLGLAFASGSPAVSIANGILALSQGTHFRITNSGPVLGRGNYRLISKVPGGSVGGSLPPATPVTIEGSGLISGGAATLSVVSGELILTVKTFTSPDANKQPPEIVFHQGFLVDAAGMPLGSPNPSNYSLVFRIYNAATGGSVLWGESQVVAVDGGRFAVHLGSGEPNLGDPIPSLPSLFVAQGVPLYLETTVKGGGGGGADLVLLPRALLPPTPFAFLARHAQAAVGLVDNSNQPIVSVVGSRVGILQPYPSTALHVEGTVRSTNLVGSGTASIGGAVIAREFRGRGIVPVGGIIVWSGTTPPRGWALCDGRFANGRKTPDLCGRFILGSGSGPGLTPRTLGNIGGAETVTMVAANLPAHGHVVDVPPVETVAGGGHNHVFMSGAGSTEGLGKDPNTAPWFGTGAFVMRNRTQGAGSHGHVLDIPSFRTAAVGSGQPQNNLPPFYAMAFVMRVE